MLAISCDLVSKTFLKLPLLLRNLLALRRSHFHFPEMALKDRPTDETFNIFQRVGERAFNSNLRNHV